MPPYADEIRQVTGGAVFDNSPARYPSNIDI